MNAHAPALMLFAVLFLSAPLALAEPFPDGPHPAFHGPGEGRGRLSPEERRALEERVQRKVDTYLTVELASRLTLDERKALMLAEVVKKEGERRRAAQKRLRAEYKALKELLDKGASEAELEAQIRRVVEAEQARESTADLLRETASFLSTREQAKLVLALPKVHREVRRMMHEARRRHRGPPRR